MSAVGGSVFLHQLGCKFAAFVFGDDDVVGAGGAHGFGIAFLAGAGDDFEFGIKGFCGDGDVEIVGNSADRLKPTVARAWLVSASCERSGPNSASL